MRYDDYSEAEPFELYRELDEYETFYPEPLGESWDGEVNRRSPAYIRWIQQSLNKILGLRLTVDGIAGRQTRSAIRDFQRRQGLTVDGLVGANTERALIAAGASSPSTAATSSSPAVGTSTAGCQKTRRRTIGRTAVWGLPGQSAFFFVSGMAVDADGAPKAYHPSKGKGLDFLGNAGRPGDWWALATDSNNKPLIQGPNDPAPGYYISTTALVDPTKRPTDPRSYVDSTAIPYVALPPEAMSRLGAKKGDFAVVINGRNRKLSFAIFAEVGPRGKLGEGSIALAQALGHDPFVGGRVRKGISNDIIYIVFPGSGNRRPRPLEEIKREGARLFAAWGGMQQVDACFPQYAHP